MADIFGCQSGPLHEFGLADADDEDDFTAKLHSLHTAWNEKGPGFFDYFVRYQSNNFVECLTLAAREKLQITGRYYNNNLELHHRLQKKKIGDLDVLSKDVINVSNVLKKWAEENFYAKIPLPIRGLGKYLLAPGYEQFQISPQKWQMWGTERRQQHIEAFHAFSPFPSATYSKPTTADKKKTVQRRVTQKEPNLFRDRVEVKTVPPVKIRKINREQTSSWEVDESADESDDCLNPGRSNARPYDVVVRDSGRSCPKKVQRCEYCKFPFNSSDKFLIKTIGSRSYTSKQGKDTSRQGNVYLHYLTGCLKGFDPKFKFDIVKIPKDAQKLMNTRQIKKLIDRGYKLV